MKLTKREVVLVQQIISNFIKTNELIMGNNPTIKELEAINAKLVAEYHYGIKEIK